MKKSEFKLRVADKDELDFDIDGTLHISVWINDNTMYDQHISQYFPELNDELELFEEVEGEMIYYGLMSKEEMAKELKKRGYNVIVNPKNKDFILTPQKFQTMANNIFGNKYDYWRINYIASENDIVPIQCPEHGEFKIKVSEHLKGVGCPKCSIIKKEGKIKSEDCVKFIVNYFIKNGGEEYESMVEKFWKRTSKKGTDIIIREFKNIKNNRIVKIISNTQTILKIEL